MDCSIREHFRISIGLAAPGCIFLQLRFIIRVHLYAFAILAGINRNNLSGPFDRLFTILTVLMNAIRGFLCGWLHSLLM